MSAADRPGQRSWVLPKKMPPPKIDPEKCCSKRLDKIKLIQQKVDRKKSQTWLDPHPLLLKPWLRDDWGRPMTSWGAFVDSQCNGWITLDGLANHLFHKVCSIPLWAAGSYSRIICYSLAIWKQLRSALPIKGYAIFGFRLESRLTTGAYLY